MTAPSPTVRGSAKSQLLLEMALTFLAVVLALIVARLALHLASVAEGTWARRVVDLASLPFVWPFMQLPGGRRPLVGDATLADITVVAIGALLLILLGARRRPV